MDLTFTGEVIEWRGPPPYLFVRLPEPQAAAVADVAPLASYGWGCITVRARVGEVAFGTALLPKDGGYLLPLKLAVRRQLGIELGDEVEAVVSIDLRG
ncbi:MAG: DUF1905 domain-containing protein [Kineosporiaceae bacterium]